MSPLHVGGLGDDPDADMTVARDGLGRAYVPGTSLAGALRADLGIDKEDPAWGYVRRGETDEGSASAVLVEDAVIILPAVGRRDGGAPVGSRAGNGIDRRRIATAPHVLYSRQVVPAGALVPLCVTVDLAEGMGDPATRALQDLLARLRHVTDRDPILLGGHTSAGLGVLTVAGDVGVSHWDLTTVDGLLGGYQPLAPDDPLRTDTARPWRPARLRIRIPWHPEGPVMVKARLDGIAVDALPYTEPAAPVPADTAAESEGSGEPSGDDGARLRLVLPGSGIRGALRTRAEYICRTLAQVDAPIGGPSREAFARQLLGEAEELRLVHALFGRPPKPGLTAQERRRSGIDVTGSSGATSVADVVSREAESGQAWRSLVEMAIRGPDSDDDAARSVPVIPALFGGRVAWHNALDRWTSAPLTGALFSVLEPHAVTWTDLTIDVRLDRLRSRAASDDGARAALYLLALVIRELAQGWIPLGYGTRRGMGTIRVDKASCTVEAHGSLPPWLQPPPGGAGLEDILLWVHETCGDSWPAALRTPEVVPS